MRGLGIHDGTSPEGGSLTFDLAQIIEALGAPALAARWRVLPEVCYVSDVDVPVFDAAAESPSPWITGQEFLAHARELRQVIDGEFEAAATGDLSSLWLVLRAVDSSWWEVYSDDPSVEAAIRRTFRDIRPARCAPRG